MTTRRDALKFAAAGLTAILGADATPVGRPFRRLGVAFGTSVSVTVVSEDAGEAEAAFDAAFAEIRAVDRLSSLTRPDSELFRLNRDGRLDDPSPALLQMLETAALMHEATAGAFDVTIQPLWRAMDGAAKRGRWLDAAELAAAQARVDQRALAFDRRSVGFLKPGMAVTLNSLSRGLAADRVAAALTKLGVARATFDTDVLGARGLRPDGRQWLARVRDPRRPERSVAATPVAGFLATSGDYQYFWTPDFSRNHIVDPRRGASPGDFASVTVRADSGLMADALSTAAFLVGREAAPALLAGFGAQALFVAKHGAVSRTPGFAVAKLISAPRGVI
jgi:FAD:protein FMN transferase